MFLSFIEANLSELGVPKTFNAILSSDCLNSRSLTPLQSPPPFVGASPGPQPNSNSPLPLFHPSLPSFTAGTRCTPAHALADLNRATIQQ